MILQGYMVPLTVEHILIECRNFTNERRTHFGNAGLVLSEIFSEKFVRFDGPLSGTGILEQ